MKLVDKIQINGINQMMISQNKSVESSQEWVETKAKMPPTMLWSVRPRVPQENRGKIMVILQQDEGTPRITEADDKGRMKKVDGEG